jgi:hemolysin activation/secretion protein
MSISRYGLSAVLCHLFLSQALAQPNDTPATAAPPVVPAEAFDVLEFRVLGVSQLSEMEISEAVYSSLGPNKSIDAVEEARQKLEAAYRARGFGTVFVDIPEQDVVEGIVRLRVTEGKVDRVRIVGAKYYSVGRIRDRLPALARGAVPSLPEVQQQLSSLNSESRDRVITPILKAGRTPGTVDVELKVEDRLPLHGSLELNDRYTPDTSRTRIAASLSYDNLFQRHDSLSLQYQTAPEEPDEARVLAATYVHRLGESGRLLALYGVDTDSDVATIGVLSVLGKGRIFGARLIQPLPALQGGFQSFSIGADYKDFEEDLRITADSGLRTPISYLVLNAAYNAGWQREKWSLGLGASSTIGIRRVLNSSSEFSDKRFAGRPNFLHVRGNAQSEWTLPFGWRLFGKGSFQFADQALVSNEQLAIGGLDTVRGYLDSEALGDRGFAASIEFRTPELAPRLGEQFSQLFGYAFYDAGIVRVIDPAPEQADVFDLASVGLGARLTAFGGVSANIDWAWPLVPGARTLDEDSRWHFGVRYEF